MNYALIFAGGVGSRMNSKAKPKQFLDIHGKPIIVHTIEHFENHPAIDEILVVCVREWIPYMEKLVTLYHLTKVSGVICGGKTALESQYNGLKALGCRNPEDIVLIHDGVRPMIDENTISTCIETAQERGSAITTAPAIETIVQVDEKAVVTNTIPRSECMLARAPQCFRLNEIIGLHEKAQRSGKYDFIDSASMMLHFGIPLNTVTGPSENIKVTTPADYYICKALLDAKENSQIFGI